MDSLLLSVVVSTYNRYEKLHLALQALSEQKIADSHTFEVLVIDNNSTDNTIEVVRSFSEILKVKFFNENQQGLGYVRQTGFKLAAGEYVAYLDDDAIPQQNWVEEIFAAILSDMPDCICGPIYPYYDVEKPAWFLDKYEIRTKGNERKYLNPGEECSGSNMIWKREILEMLNGFNISLGMTGEVIAGGEDADLFKRYWESTLDNNRKGKILYLPELAIQHWTPEYKLSVDYILKRNLAAGIAASKMRKNDTILKKTTTFIRLVAELIFVLAIFPFTRIKYTHIEQWKIEGMRKVYFRIGWLYTLVGGEYFPMQK